jgi:1-acyl-sn-glycerol-3-phosphate acyltransferase
MKKKNILYTIARPLFVFFSKCFLTPKFIGLENIPKEGRIVLAGTHTGILDSVILIASTKRQIHFLAKKELFEGAFGFIFNNIGLIPVDRKGHTLDVIGPAKKYLDKEEVVLVFPEGTFPKKGELLLPFKKGATRIAHESNTKIIPFVIKGKYRLWSRNLTIEFLKPYVVKTDNYEKETENLRNIILKKKES